jgi:cardiolipin synthase A/B
MNVQTLLTVLAFLIPLIHILGAILAAHAILFSRTSQGAIAWALSLVFFPYAAIILYLVFGRWKFHGYVEARRQGDRDIDHLADNLANALQRYRAPLAGAAQRFDGIEALPLFPFTQGNQARLLIDGTQTFEAIFAAIDAAQSYLLVQFFIIREDGLGTQLVDRLVAKAKAGVRVRLLYDEVGSIKLSRHFTQRLREAGVSVQQFNSRRGWRNRFQINFRNHRKIVVADGRIAFVGGHNVGDEYLGKSKRFGHWRDTHVQVRGPAVATVQWSFIEDWHWSTGETLDLPPHDFTAAAPAAAQDSGECLTHTLVVSTGPADDVSTCTLMFLAAISSARHRLWITSPYFVPDDTVYDALQLAAIRGVDVRIMLPSKPDHLLVYLASFSYLQSSEKAGVKFYRYSTGFLHQKVMLIDDDLSAVGTANLDNRSMHLNFELTLLFADIAFAQKVAAMLERDFAQCHRATPGDLGRRSIPFRIAVQFSRLLSPIQ